MKKKKQKEPIMVKFEYKCRRCMNIDNNTEGAEKNAHSYLLEAIYNMSIVSKESPMSLLGTHICSDGGMGITDLIGYETIKEE
jgi:hypothetical protein